MQYTKERLFGENRSHGLSLAAAIVLVGMFIVWGSNVAHNLSNAKNDLNSTLSAAGHHAFKFVGFLTGTDVRMPVKKADRLPLPFQSINVAVRGSTILLADGEPREERIFHEGEHIALRK